MAFKIKARELFKYFIYFLAAIALVAGAVADMTQNKNGTTILYYFQTDTSGNIQLPYPTTIPPTSPSNRPLGYEGDFCQMGYTGYARISDNGIIRYKPAGRLFFIYHASQ